MSISPDLDAYCARIGYTGPRAPTLAVLHDLSLHHTTSIPFENLDVMLGRGISLQPEAVFQKLVAARRGGYCFEQNGLFLRVLRALGFQATPIGARVRWQIPRAVTPPRTHLFLHVLLPEGEWLADVGLGSAALTGPIPVVFGRDLPTPHEPRRLVREEGRLFHQIRSGDEWSDVCEFTFDEMHPIDCELANWWTSANPASHFRTGVIAARARPDGTRVAIRVGEFTHRRGSVVLEQQSIETPATMLALLDQHFGLQFPAATRFDPPAAL